MKHFPGIGQVILTVAVVAAAAFVAVGLWNYYIKAPWTRDAHVRADVVQIAPDVSGLVDAVLVGDNTVVHKGDVLFRVDRQRFVLALEQAEAAVAGRQAALEQARREVERSQALREFASMDEPLEGLAPVICDQLMETISMLATSGDMTIVLVEQQIERALNFADRVMVVERGRSVWEGASAELKADRPLVNRLLGVGIH